MTATATETTTTSAPRLDVSGLWPEGYRAMAGLERAVRGSGLEASLLSLVKLRASEINGCAFCLDMHAKEARAEGESQQRLDVLPAWRETPLFTARERAALALAEAITLVADGHVPDEVVDEARLQFSDDELARLVMAITVINGWNRIAITSRTPLPPA
jgi:AhpD family alkylhydroperoxidase